MIPGMVWAWISPAGNRAAVAWWWAFSCWILFGVRGRGRSLAGFCLESVAVVALSLDSLWSSWAWILFGLALDDPGVNGCGGAVVVGLLLLDSVWRFA